MKEIIINQPHLQSFWQKAASGFLAVVSWLLWLYFLLPLFTLGGWLMGMKSLADEIRWFGGYKTLQELMQLYGEIILVIAGLWLLWTLGLSWLHASRKPKAKPPVTDSELAVAFEVTEQQLASSRASQKLTVHFDSHAVITAIDSQS